MALGERHLSAKLVLTLMKEEGIHLQKFSQGTRSQLTRQIVNLDGPFMFQRTFPHKPDNNIC